MKLINPNDDELDAAFAKKVAGAVRSAHRSGYWVFKIDKSEYAPAQMWETNRVPAFTRSMDAVLPWLERWSAANNYEYQIVGSAASVSVYLMGDVGVGKTLPLATVIALLRAHGVEVVFT